MFEVVYWKVSVTFANLYIIQEKQKLSEKAKKIKLDKFFRFASLYSIYFCFYLFFAPDCVLSKKR